MALFSHPAEGPAAALALFAFFVAFLLVGSSTPVLAASASPPLPSSPALATSPGLRAGTSSSLPSSRSSAPILIWTDRSAKLAPSPREGSAMAYDPTVGETILFGGWNGSVVYGDTWEYVAGTWTNISAQLAYAPPPLWGAVMAWDPTDGYLVLFGGENFSGITNRTWAFEDVGGTLDWVLLHPTVSPQARYIPGMVWDGATGNLLLFGGIRHVWLNDTWTFVGGNWTQDHTEPAPPWRGGPSMAYDAADGYVILTNGEATQEYQDLWVYKAGVWYNWTAIAGGSGHILRHRDGAIAVYDPVAGSTIVALGESLGAFLNNTVAFLAGNFTQLTPSVLPPGSQYAAATWDAADGYLLIFGGANGTRLINQTWAYSAPLPLVATESSSAGSAYVESPTTFTVKISGGDPPYKISWDFGDGSANQSGGTFVHTYAWPGVYLVNLTVTDNASVVNAKQYPFSVSWAPIHPLAFASATRYTGFDGIFVPFFGNASEGYPPYTAVWTFGDGTPSENGWNVTHTYPLTGTYKATLEVTDRAGRTNSTSLIITVLQAPPLHDVRVDVTVTPLTGNAPLTVHFFVDVYGGAPPYTYSWLFGDGDSSSNANATETYTQPGTYLATVVVNDPSTGNSSSQSFTIVVTGSSTGPVGPSTGFLGLPGDDGYELLGIVAAEFLLALLVGVVLSRKKRKTEPEVAPGAPPMPENYPVLPVPGAPSPPRSPPPPPPQR